MRLPHILLFITGMLPCAFAQPGNVTAPFAGMVYDERVQAFRSIHGIPGAAMLEGGRAADPPVAGAAVSNEQQMALGYAGDQLLLVRFDNRKTSRIAGAAGAVTKIVLSPSGQSALLAGTGIQVLTGLPDAPATVSIPGVAADANGAMAISDDGLLLLSTGREPANPVWSILKAGPRQIAVPGSIVAAAFQAHNENAAAITRSGDVYLIENAGGEAAVRQVWAGDDRTSSPIAIYFASDGRRIYTANASGTLAILDLEAGTVSAVSCGCVPSALDRLSGALFRITRISEGPLRLFDATTATPRVWFVPQDRATDPLRRQAR